MSESHRLRGRCGACGKTNEIPRSRHTQKVVHCAECKAEVVVTVELDATPARAPAKPRASSPSSRRRGWDAEAENEGDRTDTDQLPWTEWLICVFLPGLGLIIGFARLILNNGTGGPMIFVSLLFSFLWCGLGLGIQFLLAR